MAAVADHHYVSIVLFSGVPPPVLPCIGYNTGFRVESKWRNLVVTVVVVMESISPWEMRSCWSLSCDDDPPSLPPPYR